MVGLFIELVIKFEALPTGNFEIKQLPFQIPLVYCQHSLLVKVDENI